MNKFIAILLLAFSGSAHSEIITLKCGATSLQSFYFIVDTSHTSVKLVFDDDPNVISGILEFTDHPYQLPFPSSDTRWETYVLIDRRSGKFFYEIGVPPFRSYNPDNISYVGQCKKAENKPLL